ncbi:MAG TPA: tetratricopeptide repeat protein [Anaerolineales bacterium]|nr:tetratricopeptide repeat protein [Anaerolineales bacterium]HRQ92140.1 tetratricopeptide repeat protein [Anaerolineales bacterium]
MRTSAYLLTLLCLLTACTLPTSGGAPQGASSLTESQPQPSPTPISFEDALARAQDASNNGDWETALAYLDAALVAVPDNAQALRQRGLTHQAAGNLEPALADLSRSLEVDPAQPSAYVSRGWLLAQQGDVAAALADLNHAIQILPTYAQAYRNRAALHTSLGNFTAASFDLQIYLGLAPTAADAAIVRAELAELQQQANAQAGDTGLLFADDFSDPASGWYSNGGPETQAQYVEGGYLLGHSQPNSAVWALPGRIVSDTRIQVTATRVGGDDDNFFGLLCRVQGTGQSGDFYAFIISSDGHFGIAKSSGGSFSLIGQELMMRHMAIHQGSEPNVITAICAGSRLALYVNGEFVAETSDDTYTTGQVGLIAGTLDIQSTQILFDDFSSHREP